MTVKTCEKCQSHFVITQEDKNLLEKLSPTFGNKKYQFSLPQLCSRCREQRRMAWRNERFLFPRKCDKTGKKIISMYPADTPFPVYHNDEWWKSENDAIEYGKEIDWQRDIWQQIQELSVVAPRMFAFKFPEDRMINSEYTNCTGDLKDCYLVFNTGECEKCLCSHNMYLCNSCIDCLLVVSSELCYECVDCDKCYNLQYGLNCSGCSDSYYLNDCKECRDCIGCAGLRQKQYHIFNTPHTKEEYEAQKEKMLAENNFYSKEFQTKLTALIQATPKKFHHGENVENCVGNSVWNSKNCFHCFDTRDAEDCRYCTFFFTGRDCMDFFSWGDAELCYEISGGGEDHYQCAFTVMSYGCKDSYYLNMCINCKDCFACVGLKNKQYYILNRQYSKEEYEKLVPKLVEKMEADGQWGEFFPIAMSDFNYNKSVAHDFYPIFKEEAVQSDYKWKDEEDVVNSAKEAGAVPQLIEDVLDDICDQVLVCEKTGKPYKITPLELRFYRQMQIPIPKFCPEERYLHRLHQRNPRQLFGRKCDKCGTDIQTTFAPKRPEKVFCEKCYLEIVN